LIFLIFFIFFFLHPSYAFSMYLVSSHCSIPKTAYPTHGFHMISLQPRSISTNWILTSLHSSTTRNLPSQVHHCASLGAYCVSLGDPQDSKLPREVSKSDKLLSV
jgi:hypothetical protein